MAKTSKRGAAYIFLAFASLYLLTASQGHLYFGDSGFTIGIANHVIDDGIGPMPLVENGVNKTKWGLGQVLLDLVPVFAERTLAPKGATGIPKILVSGLMPSLIGASVPLLVCLIALRLGFAPWLAFTGAVWVGLGTMIWVYAQTLFSEPTVAVCWMLAVLSLISFARVPRMRWLLVAGLAGGYSVITKATSVAVLPVLVLYWLVSTFEQLQISSLAALRPHIATLLKQGLLLITPMLFFIGVYFWYNWVRFGDPLETGYTIERDGEFGFNTPWLTGLHGLLLSSGKGFFVYNPIALLGLLGIRPSLRFYRREALLLLGIICMTVLMHCKWWAWHGDCAWGPRFLVPLAPCLVLLSLGWLRSVVVGVRTLGSTLRTAAIGALAALSLLVQFAGCAFPPMPFINLVSSNTPSVLGGAYRPNKWPSRDDLVVLHFIPEYSPVAGHLWMLRAALTRDEPDRTTIQMAPPWLSLNPRRVGKSVKEFRPNIDVWSTGVMLGFASDPRMLTLAWSLFLVFMAALIRAGSMLSIRGAAAR